ncbi:hypothetical protein TWF730_001361 [Orbilia blumenaviensis]|uniref:Uncharacterized protein n=1 Tax=Orbilia blumenaviensis TaxID=1796055 RepID=A0AAV9UIN6_9PEZI
MAPRWFETIVGSIIGSMIGCAAVTYYISRLHDHNLETIERIGQKLQKMDDGLEGFNTSAGDLMNMISEFANNELEEDPDEESVPH